MIDPFFGIVAIGAPFAVMFLLTEARRNPSTPPSFGTCLVALFAGYGVYVWLISLSVFVLGGMLDDAGLRVLDWVAGGIATLGVGVPFFLSSRRRRLRASSQN